jgi:probable addiction module antidote protein
MKKSKEGLKEIEEMTFEEIVERGWDKISKDDLCTTIAQSLKNEKDLTRFIKCTVQDYNKTHDNKVLLHNMKIIALAKGNISALAKKTKLSRAGVYRILSKNSNPSFFNIVSISKNLGMNITFNVA